MIYHITPTNDIKSHRESSTCHCNPRVEELENGDIMIVHNSFDGREYIERLVDSDNISNN